MEEGRRDPSAARRDAVYRRLLALADVGSAAGALLFVLTVLGDDHLRPQSLLALPLVVVVGKVAGLYDREGLRLHKTTLDEAPALFQAATLYTLLVVFGERIVLHGGLGTMQGVALWLLLFLFAAGARTGARRLARRVTAVERVLVVGGPEQTRTLARKFAEGGNVKAVVVGRLPLSDGDRTPAANALGRRGDLRRVVREHAVHRVLVAPGVESSDSMLSTIQEAKALGVQVSVLPRMLEVVGSSAEFDHLYGITVLGVRRFGLSRSSAWVKRGLDVFGAGLGLLVLSPLLGAFALAVRLGSPGPVFFRQERVGRDGRRFSMVKFRTMVEGAHERRLALEVLNEADGGLFKISCDPRITRVGRLLRRTSLDELPQLWNVLRGDMSLVGPRPLIAEEDRRIEGHHRRRLHLKPGMTGQWQVLGSSRIPLREMVTIDYLYAANWSLWGDVKILLRTVPHMLGRRGM